MTSSLTFIGFTLWAGAAAAAPEEIHTDYMRSTSTEAAYTFVCGRTRTILRVAEEIRSAGGAGRLADRWRVRLLELKVKGRRIAAGEARRAARALHRYSWLTRVQGRCTAGGTVSLWIEGMPAEAWADFAQGRLPARPATTATTLEIDSNGNVDVR